MTDEFTMTIKEILDRAGLDISVEQIEEGLNAMAEEIPDEDPWLDEIIKKIEAERKGQGEPPEEGRSYKGTGKYLVMSGQVDLEYTGRAHKKYQGYAILLIKPDDSIVVHGLRGVNPVSYISRADDIRFRGKDRKFTVTAIAGSDRLVMTFLRMSAFEDLFEKMPLEKISLPAVQPVVGQLELTDEEKALEARLKKLRIELARREGISFLPAVFDNKTMHQLVTQRPKTLEELKQVKGFGTKRIERYAAGVLETINGSAGAQADV
jgi:superfamily II DNA helicase RecQ